MSVNEISYRQRYLNLLKNLFNSFFEHQSFEIAQIVIHEYESYRMDEELSIDDSIEALLLKAMEEADTDEMATEFACVFDNVVADPLILDLLSNWLDSKNNWLRVAAATIFYSQAKLANARLFISEKITARLGVEKNTEIKILLLRALGEASSEPIHPKFLVGEKNAQVREEAVKAYYNIASRGNSDFKNKAFFCLANITEIDRNNDVRRAAIKAVLSLGGVRMILAEYLDYLDRRKAGLFLYFKLWLK